jgi:sterol desaturase/sphingolipid hydroxylase (fatty acid hydroxylase superfamily)
VAVESQPLKAPKTVELSAVAEVVGSFDQEKRARVWSMNADTFSRVFMVFIIAVIFVGLNYQVMRLVERGFDADMLMMQKFPQAFKPADRVITANVFMSLIGGTVVQVGVATIAIVSYLFPKKPAGR